MKFFQKHKMFRDVLIAVVLSFALGMVAREFYKLGYRAGRERPCYIAHDTGSSFYIESVD